MDVKPIPAFYCCYLLRSTVRHTSLYVGSTPNPCRRLAQHNGQVKGGAVRTSRISLRPWEMTCVVAGFPSNIAALQFEWGWQNAHLTRHIPHNERISFATTLTKTSFKTGRTRRRPGRPRVSLIDKLSNLHLLLRVPYFSKWPLELRFFSEDVFQFWQSWCQRIDAQIPPWIKVWLDKPKEGNDLVAQNPVEPRTKRQKLDAIGRGGVDGVDSTYISLRPVLEKAQLLLEEENDLVCSLCKESLDPKHDLITICSQANCQSTYHMTCLSDQFLKAERTASMVPGSGDCPSCKTRLSWVELMKETTLRIRGGNLVNRILSEKNRMMHSGVPQADALEDERSDELDVDELDEDGLTAAEVDNEDSDDNASVTSVESERSLVSIKGAIMKARSNTTLATVIEDSDADVIDLLSD